MAPQVSGGPGWRLLPIRDRDGDLPPDLFADLDIPRSGALPQPEPEGIVAADESDAALVRGSRP
jgi:hypothetical protein